MGLGGRGDSNYLQVLCVSGANHLNALVHDGQIHIADENLLIPGQLLLVVGIEKASQQRGLADALHAQHTGVIAALNAGFQIPEEIGGTNPVGGIV